MATGDNELTVAWHTLCERLTALGTRVGADPFPPTGSEHAVDVRHLARQLVLALQGELEHGDPVHPSFHRYEEPWAQWGGPNPDNVYTRAVIDPAATYRVSGNVAGVRTAIFSLVEGDMHLGRYAVFAEHTLGDLAVPDDGAFELWISPEAHDGNWLPAHTDARYLLVRQYQCDWECDRVATLLIERVDTGGRPATPPSEPEVAAALARAGDWVEQSLEYWCTYVERARAGLPRNAMAPPGTPKGGAPNIAYGAGWWELGPDDALVLTTERPDADYWGFTVHHRFRLDSGDFAGRATSLNMTQAFVDDDGSVRIVVAATDPGVPNWVDTEGRPEGMLVYRSIGTRTRPVPSAAVVPASEVRAQVPASHPVVDATQRREQLGRRRAAVLCALRLTPMVWSHKPRPHWVHELNAFGGQLGSPAALVHLDEASLLDDARRQTGLDDFGDDDPASSWREGLHVFCAALDDEADLNFLGRIMARNDIVRALVNRLQVHTTLTQHPEILEQPVASPVLVVGTGRSGTSLLHELLAQDPRHRVARTWELLHPCPPPERATYRTDPRIAAADQEYRFWHLVAPEYQTMHENGGDVPNEDPLIDMLEFASDHLMGSYPVPTYTRWLARDDPAPAFRAHRRFLQLLQWRCAGDRWVLKSPSYLAKLPAFFAEYPDAYVVLTHRDPLVVLPSLVSVMATLQWMHSDTVDVERIVKSAVHGTAIAMDLVMGWRSDGTIPDERIVDVRFADLASDPVATVGTVLDRTGGSLDSDAEQRMRGYLDARPRHRHGVHDYDFADTGLDPDETRARFAAYQARYDVPSER